MKQLFLFLVTAVAFISLPINAEGQNSVAAGTVKATGLKDSSPRPRMRDYGVRTGVMQPGPLNAITDVKGVSVGHVTLVAGDSIRTGGTAIIPHPGNIFREKVPAAFWAGLL